jgi:hypothetical protein
MEAELTGNPFPGNWRSSLTSLPRDSRVVLDLDHTLFLSNSTSEYLRSVAPRPLSVLVLAIIRVLRPWRLAWWIPKESRHHLADPIRIITCTILFPWAFLRWRKVGPTIGARFANTELLDALEESGRKDGLVVATLGHRFVVRPLLEGIGIDGDVLIAGNFWTGHRLRVSGKVPALVAELGDEALSTAYFLTDSLDDRSLLEAVAWPHLFRWPTEVVRTIWDGMYLPFSYIERIKRPGQQEVLRQILLDDWPLLFLAIGITSPMSIWLIAALAAALVSFFCVYEVGYWENDVLGAQREGAPRLSGSFDADADYGLVPWAYVWAGALGVSAAWFASIAGQRAFTTMALGWAALLVALRLVFAVYNRAPVSTRMGIFPLLQIAKTFGFGIFAAISLPGALFMVAQVVRRSWSYFIYRTGGSERDFPNLLLRTALYVVFVVVVAMFFSGPAILSNSATWLIGAWALARSASHIMLVWNRFRLST